MCVWENSGKINNKIIIKSITKEITSNRDSRYSNKRISSNFLKQFRQKRRYVYAREKTIFAQGLDLARST